MNSLVDITNDTNSRAWIEYCTALVPFRLPNRKWLAYQFQNGPDRFYRKQLSELEKQEQYRKGSGQIEWSYLFWHKMTDIAPLGQFWNWIKCKK